MASKLAAKISTSKSCALPLAVTMPFSVTIAIKNFHKIDQMDLGVIEGVIIPALEWRTPCIKAMVLGDELLRDYWIIDSGTYFAGHPVRVQPVGLAVSVRAAEIAQSFYKSGLIVELLP